MKSNGGGVNEKKVRMISIIKGKSASGVGDLEITNVAQDINGRLEVIIKYYMLFGIHKLFSCVIDCMVNTVVKRLLKSKTPPKTEHLTGPFFPG